MSRAKFLFALASAALIAFLIQTVSGFVLWLVLPRGGGNGFGWGGGDGNAGDSTFIWDRHTWLDIHDWTGVALLIVIVVHVYIHRKWLYLQLRSLFRPR